MADFHLLFQRYRLLTNTLLAILFALIILWNILRPSGFNIVVLLIQLFPLAALLPALRSRYYRAYSWLCFLILLYFVFAVMGALSSIANVLDYLFVLLCMALFVSSMMCSRYAQRVQKNISQ